MYKSVNSFIIRCSKQMSVNRHYGNKIVNMNNMNGKITIYFENKSKIEFLVSKEQSRNIPICNTVLCDTVRNIIYNGEEEPLYTLVDLVDIIVDMHECYQSNPCQHNCTLVFQDGVTFSTGLLWGDMIYRILEHLGKKNDHFKYLENSSRVRELPFY